MLKRFLVFLPIKNQIGQSLPHCCFPNGMYRFIKRFVILFLLFIFFFFYVSSFQIPNNNTRSHPLITLFLSQYLKFRFRPWIMSNFHKCFKNSRLNLYCILSLFWNKTSMSMYSTRFALMFIHHPFLHSYCLHYPHNHHIKIESLRKSWLQLFIYMQVSFLHTVSSKVSTFFF